MVSQILRPGVLYHSTKTCLFLGLTSEWLGRQFWPIPESISSSYVFWPELRVFDPYQPIPKHNKHHVSRKRGLSPVDLSKSQQHIHAWKPKKHDFVLADLALVNLLVNGASGKEPGHINPCWLMFAYLHTHVDRVYLYMSTRSSLEKPICFINTLGLFHMFNLNCLFNVLFRVLPCFTRPCGTCRCSRASFVRHATPGPSPASPWIPRKNARPEVVTGWCESVNIIPSQHYRKYLPVKILTSKNSYQLQYDPTCPIICSKL